MTQKWAPILWHNVTILYTSASAKSSFKRTHKHKFCQKLSCVWCSLCFCHFRKWCLQWGVVPDCIDSWSLLSSLLVALYVLCGGPKSLLAHLYNALIIPILRDCVYNRVLLFFMLFYWPFEDGVSFVDPFCYLCFTFAMSLLYCLVCF